MECGVVDSKKVDFLSFSEGNYNIFIESTLAKQKFKPVNLLQINTCDPENIENHIYQINNALQKNTNYKLHTWQDNNEHLIKALKVEKNCMIVILILILSSFIMMSSLFMLVREKFLEICMLRTIGATKINIVWIFILNGILNSLIGVLIGSSMSYVILKNFDKLKHFLSCKSNVFFLGFLAEFLEHINLKFNLMDFVLICILALIISTCPTIYPSFKAASFTPSRGMKM